MDLYSDPRVTDLCPYPAYREALGAIFAGWGLFERHLVLFAESLFEDRDTAAAVLDSVSSVQARVAILTAVARVRFPGRLGAAIADTLQERVRKAIETRNRYAHGHWRILDPNGDDPLPVLTTVSASTGRVTDHHLSVPDMQRFQLSVLELANELMCVVSIIRSLTDPAAAELIAITRAQSPRVDEIYRRYD